MYRVLSLQLLARYPSCDSKKKKAADNQSKEAEERPTPRFIAHRGRLADDGSKGFENSMRAFENCLKEKVEMVELDVQLTKDGHVIVFHDEILQRLHPKILLNNVFIRELDRRQIPSDVPNFEDVVKLLSPSVPLLVEIKSDNLTLVEKVASIIDQHGDWRKIVWGSFSSKRVNQFCKQLQPTVPIVYTSRDVVKTVLCYYLGILPFVSVRAGDHIWLPNDLGYWLLSSMMEHLGRRGVVVVACNYQEGAINLPEEVWEAFQSGATTVSTERYNLFASTFRISRTLRNQ